MQQCSTVSSEVVATTLAVLLGVMLPSHLLETAQCLRLGPRHACAGYHGRTMRLLRVMCVCYHGMSDSDLSSDSQCGRWLQCVLTRAGGMPARQTELVFALV